MKNRTQVLLLVYFAVVLGIVCYFCQAITEWNTLTEEELIITHVKNSANFRIEYREADEICVVESTLKTKVANIFCDFVDSWVEVKSKNQNNWSYRVTFNFDGPNDYNFWDPIVFVVYTDGIEYEDKFYTVNGISFEELYSEIDTMLGAVIDENK